MIPADSPTASEPVAPDTTAGGILGRETPDVQTVAHVPKVRAAEARELPAHTS